MDEFPRFADFAEEPGTLDGSKMKLDDIVNQEILIIGHRINPSKYPDKGSGKCLTLQFRIAGDPEMHVVFTGSAVLAEQAEKYAEMMPFMTTLRKKNRHYEMT